MHNVLQSILISYSEKSLYHAMKLVSNSFYHWTNDDSYELSLILYYLDTVSYRFFKYHEFLFSPDFIAHTFLVNSKKYFNPIIE